MELNHLIEQADRQDHSKGEKKWARQCKIHNLLEIERLERKEIERMYK